MTIFLSQNHCWALRTGDKPNRQAIPRNLSPGRLHCPDHLLRDHRRSRKSRTRTYPFAVALRLHLLPLEIALLRPAPGAGPIVRQIFKTCPRSDSMIRIALRGIVDISALLTHISIHQSSSFHPNLRDSQFSTRRPADRNAWAESLTLRLRTISDSVFQELGGESAIHRSVSVVSAARDVENKMFRPGVKVSLHRSASTEYPASRAGT